MNLIEDGIVVHKNAISKSDVRKFLAVAARSYEMVEAVKNGAKPKGKHAEAIQHIAEDTIRWGGISIGWAFKIAAGFLERGAFERVTARAESLVADHRKTAGARFRDDLSYLRRHSGSSTHVPWHFDAGAAGTGQFDPCWNVWMPLVPVGEHSPTLQFIPGTSEVMKGARLPCYRPGYPEPESVPEDHWMTPVLDPGDVVIFDHWTLHRTQPVGGLMRTSAEIRLSCL